MNALKLTEIILITLLTIFSINITQAAEMGINLGPIGAGVGLGNYGATAGVGIGANYMGVGIGIMNPSHSDQNAVPNYHGQGGADPSLYPGDFHHGWHGCFYK